MLAQDRVRAGEIVLEFYQRDGTITQEGVQVRDYMSGSTAAYDTSFGMNVDGTASGVQPNSFSMSKCMFDNTDYAALRFGDTDDLHVLNSTVV